MHVAYIHQYFSTKAGATGTRSYEMSQRLLAHGHRVTMITGVSPVTAHCFQTNGRVTELEIDNIRVMCIAEPYANQMSFVRRLIAFGRFAREAQRVVRKLDADLVFATSTPLTVGLPGKKSAAALGVPFVFEVRDLWPEVPIALGVIKNPLLKWYTKRMERSIYAAAERIVALSPGMKEGIAGTGYPVDRITMVPNGCDLDLFRPSAEPLDDERFGAPDDFRLAFTGAHGLANGLDAVLDAAGELKRRGVKGVRFVFIGDGKLKATLMERWRAEGLDDYVCWVAPIPKLELARVLPRMDVGMMILKNMPAFYYGTSPNKFFDYIASGLPVLNNYPGWLADMITKHRFGKAVPPDDPVAFADAVVWFMENRAERPEMGARARTLAESEFDRVKLGERFVGVLEAAYAGRRGGAAVSGS